VPELTAYTFNRRRGVQGCMGAVMVSLSFAFIAIGALFPVRAVGVFAVLFGLVIAWFALLLLLDIFTPNPILTISAQGVCFLPFSPAVVPWSEITAVTMAQGYYYGTQGVTGGDGKFGFTYAIRDPERFPKRGGISGIARATMTQGSVRLNTLTLIDARWQDLEAAFRAHYPGKIVERPLPGAT
jgi:hypothetical protein